MGELKCPEGHDHTSDCRRNGCPCDTDHGHTTRSEFARSGGLATFAKYGREHMSKIAKGWPKGKKRKR